MSEATDEQPATFFPLLPVTREKDRWRKDKYGTEYKVRLCLDLKQGGLNDGLEDWPFRYWGLDCVAENVNRGDWLATLDISRFYLRLPAGERLRSIQWFQDPGSYADCTQNNDAMKATKLRFRQLRSVAFGLKSAPVFASAVSMEATRILRSFGVNVAGVYLDDLLIRGETEKTCRESMDLAGTILAAIGLPTNDKTVGPYSPDQGIVFLGVRVCTADCSMSTTTEYRECAKTRVLDALAHKSISVKTLDSIAGILTWVAYVFVPGKPRRNSLYRALAELRKTGSVAMPLSGALRQQLQWWARALESSKPSSFFWDTCPDTPLMRSDASGEDGWGVCVLGLHIVGPWPDGWRLSDGASAPSMLVKEVLPPAVATILLARWIEGSVLASAADNAGTAFVLNSLSPSCPICLTLLRPVADAINTYHLGLIGGHARRGCNQHADDLSHALSASSWSQVRASQSVHKPHRLELPFAVMDVRTGECFTATISFARPLGLGALHAGT